MPTNTNLNEALIKAEDIMTLEAVRTSKHPDAKNIFKHEAKEAAFKKRYGKETRIAVTYEGINGAELKSFDDLKEYTVRFESKGNHYAITEYLKNGLTDNVILSYRKNGRTFENQFSRFVDAEITLADLISEES